MRRYKVLLLLVEALAGVKTFYYLLLPTTVTQKTGICKVEVGVNAELRLEQPALPRLFSFATSCFPSLSVSHQSLNVFATVMQKAWRERNPQARIKAAYQALELNNE